jgi:LuxR family transcriptional regulator, maltose regulon positive regulatory protein
MPKKEAKWMADELLTIKLFAPPLRPRLVNRPHLVEKLNAGLQNGSRLTLISAPAGYGKTTLVLEWLKIVDRPYSWLSLDRGDDQPTQFLAYLMAALQQINPRFTISTDAPSASSNPADWLQSHLIKLSNRIANTAEAFILVLDDYHIISDLAIHQALGFFLEHSPAQMHVIITTRQDPMLPLARLRSRGQLTEIRLGELRFSPEEAAEFLNGTMGLGLVPDQISALETRTEGWIAGLQLAALSLSEDRSRSSSSTEADRRAVFIHAFAGDDRHVMDYLIDEVLSRQPEHLQKFLLQTSLLKRLCGSLCDAVIGREEIYQGSPGSSPDSFGSSQQILEYLESTNLFIIPLDNRRQWYRYHHLFADLLSSRLQNSNPNRVIELHNRASQWYEQAGMLSEAIEHALLTRNFDRALHLIEHAARTSIWASGDLPMLLNWSKKLPEAVLLTRPHLCLYYARALFFIGQVEAAEGYIRGVEADLQSRGITETSNQEIWGLLLTNRATFESMSGHAQAALDLAQRALAIVPQEDIFSRARIAHALGTVYYHQGEVAQAERQFTQAIQFADQAANRNLGLDCYSCLALAQILGGKLSQAEINQPGGFEHAACHPKRTRGYGCFSCPRQNPI